MDQRSSTPNSQSCSNHPSDRSMKRNKSKQSCDNIEGRKNNQACDKNDQNCNG